MKPKNRPTCPVCGQEMLNVDGRWYCPYRFDHHRWWLLNVGPGPAEDGGPQHGVEAYTY